ncbi:hypothetical protein KDL44_04615 [bacterium]|nr:hypothetical protein [bacterium]
MRYIPGLILATVLMGGLTARADEIDEAANAAENRAWLSKAAAEFSAGVEQGLPLYAARTMESLPAREEYLEREGWCSYYCCAPQIDASASSSLAASGGLSYGAEQAWDYDTATAWVEGVDGDGMGQSLSYAFRTHAGENPDGAPYQQQYVNGLEIITGYSKSAALHAANGAVLQLKLSINGQAVCFVDLQDSMDIQEVTFEPVYLGGEKDPVLTLEISGVRKGGKYSDTAISEIVFRGGPCH